MPSINTKNPSHCIVCTKEFYPRISSLNQGQGLYCGHKCSNKFTHLVHGHARKGLITHTYHSWEAMKARCYDPNHINYSRYGAIGIRIEDPRWFIFTNFLEDMKECPEGMSIERKDNTKGYYKDNCKWATALEQARNRKNTPMITYLNRTQSIASWADELGYKYYTLRARLVNYNWSIERAMTTPV